MRVSREYERIPARGPFGRMARRHGWKTGWVFWAEGKSRDGYHVAGMGQTAREAINDLVEQRKGAR